MSLEQIRKYIEQDFYLYSNKTRRRIAAGVITTAQVRQTILKGTRRKIEADERSDGRFNKYTIHWHDWYVVVKNTDRPFIITAGRLD